MLTSRTIILVVFSIVLLHPLEAQRLSYSIDVSAVVVENLQLVTIRDLDLLLSSVQGNVIIINPTTDTNAGLFKIKGSPNRVIRINFTPREIITEQKEGVGIVQAVYTMSTFGNDNQFASLLLTPGTADLRIGQQGEVFVWLGAEFDISQASQGSYISQFVLEMEYL